MKNNVKVCNVCNLTIYWNISEMVYLALQCIHSWVDLTENDKTFIST